MNRQQLITFYAILFLLLSLDTAFSLTDSHNRAVNEIMEKDGVVTGAYSVEEVDLDKDGQNETVVTYITGLHHTGAKVIKFDGDKPVVLFEHGCSTPNARFEIVNNIPTLIFEESNYTPDYATGKRYEETYRWDGKTFSKADE